MGVKGVYTLGGASMVLFPLAALGDRSVHPHWPSIAIASLFCLTATFAVVLFPRVREDLRRVGLQQIGLHKRRDRFVRWSVVMDNLMTLNLICVPGLFGYFMILWGMGRLG
jgi:hypothetical protein